MSFELDNRGSGEVIDCSFGDPTRAFECFDPDSGESLGVILVGEPKKAPPHYRHNLRLSSWWVPGRSGLAK